MSAFHDSALIGASGQGEYQIERSLRFNSADSAYLSRTPASAGNRKTWTWAGWVKRSPGGERQTIFVASTASPNNQTFLDFYQDALLVGNVDGGGGVSSLITSAVYRDFSSWYHIVCVVDTTASASSDRTKLYVNGIQITEFSTASYPTQNYDTHINNTIAHSIGLNSPFSLYPLDGYLADVHFIDGQALAPTSFGEFDANGVWQPKAYTGSYGTNGFHLPFNDNSSAAALGTDTSGNNNNWSVNNISVAAGAGNDSLVDSPTNYGTDTGVGNEVRGNYATLNPLSAGANVVLSNGNLQMTGPAAFRCSLSSIAVTGSGKWYAEIVATTSVFAQEIVGIATTTDNIKDTYVGATATSYGYYNNGEKYNNASGATYGAGWATGDVIGIALDLDAGTLVFYKNGSSQGTAYSGLSSSLSYYFVLSTNSTSSVLNVNFGQRPFAYPAPSGFKALTTANLPTPTIADGSTAMDVVTYTGNGGTQTISGLEFSPDLVWLKVRSFVYVNGLHDSVRGGSRILISNSTSQELVNEIDGSVSTFNSDGFTISPGTRSNDTFNAAGQTYVAWTWDAGSSIVTNNDGTITSQVRANPSAGFSVASWNANGSVSTVGHGLNVKPSLVIHKPRTGTYDWAVITDILNGNLQYLYLNSIQTVNNTGWGSSPTSTVMSVYSYTNGLPMISYVFAPVEGYSAFGSYTGNGSTDGPFVFCNFRPRWVMVKASSSTGSWYIYDSNRDTYNVATSALFPNTSDGEVSIPAMDLLSNGFKLKYEATYGANYNGNGVTYIYAAFAENPFALARAR